MTTIETSDNITLKVGDSLSNKFTLAMWKIVNIQGQRLNLVKVIGGEKQIINFDTLAYSWSIGLLEVTEDTVTYRKKIGSDSKLQI